MAATRFEIEVSVNDGPVQKLVGQLKTLGEEGERATKRSRKGFSRLDGMIRRLPRPLQQVIRSIGNFGKAGLVAAASIAGIALAITGFIKVMGPAIRAASAFQREMGQVETLFKDARLSINQMSTEILELAARTPLALRDLTKALYQTISAGIEGAEAMGVLEEAARAAVGGATNIETAVDGITSALNAWGIAAENARAVSDAFFVAVRNGKTTFQELSNTIGGVAPVAASVGVSLEEVLAAVTTLTQSGVRTNQAMTQVRSLLVAIARQVPQTIEVADQLGLSFNVTALRAKGLQRFIEDATKAVEGNESAATRLVGRIEAMQALMLLGGNAAESFKRNLEDMARGTGAADTAFNRMQNTVSVMADEINNKFKVIQTRIGQSFLPTIERVLRRLNSELEKGLGLEPDFNEMMLRGLRSLDLQRFGAEISDQIEALELKVQLSREVGRLEEIDAMVEEIGKVQIQLEPPTQTVLGRIASVIQERIGRAMGNLSGGAVGTVPLEPADMAEIWKSPDVRSAADRFFQELVEQSGRTTETLKEDMKEALTNRAMVLAIKEALGEATTIDVDVPALKGLGATSQDMMNIMTAASEHLGSAMEEAEEKSREIADRFWDAANQAVKLETTLSKIEGPKTPEQEQMIADLSELQKTLLTDLGPQLDKAKRRYEAMAQVNGEILDQLADYIAAQKEAEEIEKRRLERNQKVEAFLGKDLEGGGIDAAMALERERAAELNEELSKLNDRILEARRTAATGLFATLDAEMQRLQDLADALPGITEEGRKVKETASSVTAEFNMMAQAVADALKADWGKLETSIKNIQKKIKDTNQELEGMDMSSEAREFLDIQRDINDRMEEFSTLHTRLNEHLAQRLDYQVALEAAERRGQGNIEDIRRKLAETRGIVAESREELEKLKAAMQALGEIGLNKLRDAFYDLNDQIKDAVKELDRMVEMIEKVGQAAFIQAQKRRIFDLQDDIEDLEDARERLQRLQAAAIDAGVSIEEMAAQLGLEASDFGLFSWDEEEVERVMANAVRAQNELKKRLEREKIYLEVFTEIDDDAMKESLSRVLSSVDDDQRTIILDLLVENEGDVYATLGDLGDRAVEVLSEIESLEDQIKKLRRAGVAPDDPALLKLEKDLRAAKEEARDLNVIFSEMADEMLGTSVFGPLMRTLSKIQKRLENAGKEGLKFSEILSLVSMGLRGLIDAGEGLGVLSDKFVKISRSALGTLTAVGGLHDSIKKIGTGELSGLGAVLGIAGPALGIAGGIAGVLGGVFGESEEEKRTRQERMKRLEEIRDAIRTQTIELKRSFRDAIREGFIGGEFTGRDAARIEAMARALQRTIAGGQTGSGFNTREFFDSVGDQLEDLVAMGAIEEGFLDLFDKVSDAFDKGETTETPVSALVKSGIWDALWLARSRLITFGDGVAGASEKLGFMQEYLDITGTQALTAFARELLSSGQRLGPEVMDLLESILDPTATEPVLRDMARDLAQQFLDADREARRAILGDISFDEFTALLDVVEDSLDDFAGAIETITRALGDAAERLDRFRRFVSEDLEEGWEIFVSGLVDDLGLNELKPAMATGVLDLISGAGDVLDTGGKPIAIQTRAQHELDKLDAFLSEFGDQIRASAPDMYDALMFLREQLVFAAESGEIDALEEAIGAVEAGFADFAAMIQEQGVTGEFQDSLNNVVGIVKEFGVTSDEAQAAIGAFVKEWGLKLALMDPSEIQEKFGLTAEQLDGILGLFQTFQLDDSLDPFVNAFLRAIDAVDIFTEYMGLTMPEAFEKFISYLEKGAETPEQKALIAELKALDLSSPEGQARLNEIVRGLAEGFLEGETLGMDDADFKSFLATLKDFAESAEREEEPAFSRSVQIARTITEIQASEVITLLNEASYWLEKIYGAVRGFDSEFVAAVASPQMDLQGFTDSLADATEAIGVGVLGGALSADLLSGLSRMNSAMLNNNALDAGVPGDRKLVFNQTFNLEQDIDRILREFELSIRRSNYSRFING